MSSFCPHDFYDAVVVVSSSRMDGDSGWLVDDYHVVVLVYDADWLCSHGGLVAVQGM